MRVLGACWEGKSKEPTYSELLGWYGASRTDTTDESIRLVQAFDLRRGGEGHGGPWFWRKSLLRRGQFGFEAEECRRTPWAQPNSEQFDFIFFFTDILENKADPRNPTRNPERAIDALCPRENGLKRKSGRRRRKGVSPWYSYNSCQYETRGARMVSNARVACDPKGNDGFMDTPPSRSRPAQARARIHSRLSTDNDGVFSNGRRGLFMEEQQTKPSSM